jgi:hypothetical protein
MQFAHLLAVPSSAVARVARPATGHRQPAAALRWAGWPANARAAAMRSGADKLILAYTVSGLSPTFHRHRARPASTCSRGSQPKMTSTKRRFPPPWSIEEVNDACFIVKDGNYEEEAGRRSVAKSLNEGRGATDRGQRGEAAGAVEV